MSEQQEAAPEKDSRFRSCKLCGTQISPYTPFCRNCGHPQGSALAVWLLGSFLLLLIALYLAMTFFCMCNVQGFRQYNQPRPAPSSAPRNP